MGVGTVSLSASAQAVFIALSARAKATRPQLAVDCGLSKPTVSAAVSELEGIELIERNGAAHGTIGRTAAVYRLGPAAGYVLAVDHGSTQVSFRAVALDGRLLDEAHTGTPSEARAMVRAALRRRRRSGPLRAVVVAVSDVVTPAGRVGDPAVDERVRAAVDGLGLPAAAPVLTENNVNCAAIAELREGAAGSRDTFVYLQVGVGIGAGIVVNGRLVRGENGAAGELARLAYPWADDRPAGHEALEARLGSPGLLRRVRARWSTADGPLPRDAAALFALAERGHSTAAGLVREHSLEVGKLAASLSAVLDPGLVVLGGGVGANPLLTPGVVETLAGLSWPTEVVVSRLGDRATVLGAARLAREQGVRRAVVAL
ncbi:putative NBD/HSP70 family sugar kinase [Kutzneria kofuensis]|uniref:Putative NBD/HSP70 family sugar kinase n=1 Tax=Kutzneria kofuensis TaxID=103725 RepID=A0A7W9KSD8_9PSEU|nr:putative NBD/HSP70 family sugar kinase [Kutzneria kofuensis]